MADGYQAERQANRSRALVWGEWQIPESELHLLGDVSGKDVLEFGCGAAELSISLVRAGAKCIGLDASRGQLAHALELTSSQRVPVPLVQALGESAPFVDESFDVVVADYGVFLWVDPYLAVPEAARMLRTGGLLLFSTLSPLLVICWPPENDPAPPGRVLEYPYFGMHVLDVGDEGVNYNLPYGEWIRLFRANDLAVEDLVEIRPPDDAPEDVAGRPKEWAQRWPAEHFWKARKV
jgi:SAM-dependent methyltransferase